MIDYPRVIYGLAIVGGVGGALLSGKAIYSIIRNGKIATKPGFPELSARSRPGAFWFFIGWILMTGIGMAAGAVVGVLHVTEISN